MIYNSRVLILAMLLTATIFTGCGASDSPISVTPTKFILATNTIIPTPEAVSSATNDLSSIEPPTVEPTFPPTQEALKGVVWKIIPISVQMSEPSNGWVYYSFQYVLENQGDQTSQPYPSTGNGTVETEEGFTYSSEHVRTKASFPSGAVVPPKFRIVGSSDPIQGNDNTFSTFFSVAENSHPTRIVFSDYGVLELNVVDSSSLSFPTDEPRSSFLDLEQTLEVSDSIKLTFKKPHISGYGIYTGLTIDVEFENLNQGYDSSLDIHCIMIDGKGYIRGDQGTKRFVAGPGQTVTNSLVFYITDPPRAFVGDSSMDDATLKTFQNNAKLICTEGINAIFNLD